MAKGLILVFLLALSSSSSSGSKSSTGGIISSTGCGSYYDVLEIQRTATQREIRAAYRAAALQWHPDKNVGNEKEAERRFIEISEAFSVLRDETARRQYDSSGTTGRGSSSVRRGSGFDFNQASELFKENFGETLWKHWSPGQEITGVLQRHGKRISVTIHPDGSSEEHEEDSAGGSYTYVKSGGSGGTSVSISFSGGLGQLFSDMLMPRGARELPGGAFVAWGLSWVPAVGLLMCCGRCFGVGRTKRKAL
ncbi:DnaJ domain-containing protein [Baffinella frigidus]|nr:DnaJ domain-containing protein [Cryptophyta sp. CCMP2293]